MKEHKTEYIETFSGKYCNSDTTKYRRYRVINYNDKENIATPQNTKDIENNNTMNTTKGYKIIRTKNHTTI